MDVSHRGLRGGRQSQTPQVTSVSDLFSLATAAASIHANETNPKQPVIQAAWERCLAPLLMVNKG